MKHQLIAIEDAGQKRVVASTFTPDLAGDAAAFIAKNDRQGVSIYNSVNLLKSTATRRCKERWLISLPHTLMWMPSALTNHSMK